MRATTQTVMGKFELAFGQQLRLERERQGVSLDVLCARTKVKREHLDALEQGQFGRLPGGVFRRGIARASLDALGLDGVAWMPHFEASYAAFLRASGTDTEHGTGAWETFAANVKNNRAPRGRSLAARWLGVLALLLVLLAASAAVYYFLLRGRLNR